MPLCLVNKINIRLSLVLSDGVYNLIKVYLSAGNMSIAAAKKNCAFNKTLKLSFFDIEIILEEVKRNSV